MAAEQIDFHEILNALLSFNNEVRQSAEEKYNNLPVDVKVTQLLSAIHTNVYKDDVRLMAAVVLRRLFASEFQEFYSALPPEQQISFRQQILLAVQQDVCAELRRKICEVVAEVARNLIDDDGNNQWTEILQFLFQCANSQNAQLQESALRIFTGVPGVFGNLESQYMELIKQMLQKSLDASSAAEVQIQAVCAVCAFINRHSKDTNVLKHFSDVLPRIILIIGESVKTEDDQTLLKLLIELAENCPKFLRPQLDFIFDMCIKIFASQDMDDSWRHLALEVMVTFAENAAPMVRKHADKYIEALIPLVLQMMTDIEDEPEWSVSDEVADEDNSDNNCIAESALDRLACGLGGKAVLPRIIKTIPSMLNHAEWSHRYAALMAISAVGEGCHNQMETMLDDIMRGVLNYISDPHPRVRYAACNAIGQMSTDFAPIFEKKFHEQVIPGLLALLGDVENPRVQAHAGAALVNFSEDCPKHILTKYLDDIMKKLESILTEKFKQLVETGTKLVLEQIVTTIASVADTVEKDFIPYYDRFMPCLKYIIEQGTSDELRMLRGKTIECVSLIGLSVGQEVFMNDANAIMALLLKTHTEGELADDDPQTSYLISAWARMCKILGKQFEQYLPLVMGPVMRTAALKPNVTMLDNDEIEDIENDADWSYINLGEQQNFAIRTAGMDDKACACDMLVCYARELKEGFADYCEEVVRLMVPMLKFYFHDGVRSAAAESIPYLLDCAKIKGTTYLEGMWLYICPELLKAIDTEPEADVLAELLHALAKSIETLGPNCLSTEAMDEVLKLINKFMSEHFEREEKRAQARNEEDYDEGVEEQLAEEDDNDILLLSKISDIVHALFSTYKTNFLPFFDRIVSSFVKLLDPSRPWADRQWGLCIFDEVIEYSGPLCAQYQHIFLQPLLEYTKDKSPEVRQAAAYGCGVLAQFAGEQFAVPCAQIIPRLVEIINTPGSRDIENINPTENAISAVTKILKYNNSAISNIDELINLWFSWLPVVEDEEEAPHVYGYLCDLIQTNHPVILGANNTNLPRIVTVIAEAFYRDVIGATIDVGRRMVEIVKQIEQNPDVFQVCLGILTEDQKHALEEAYREVATTVV